MSGAGFRPAAYGGFLSAYPFVDDGFEEETTIASVPTDDGDMTPVVVTTIRRGGHPYGLRG